MPKPAAKADARWLAVLALGVVLAVAGYWLQFTTFMLYDDEGYVLFSLRNFSSHGALYDQVYSQYGPFFYLLYDALHRLLHFEFTNVSGRWITLLNWIGTSGVCAAVVARWTRSAVASALTMTLTFAYLWIMINEPMHPGGLIALLIATGVWLGAELWSAGRTKAFAISMGVVGCSLFLTKINVGVFFIAAVAAWLGVNLSPATAARRATWGIALLAAVLPLWLMKSLHDQRWIQLYSLVFAAGMLATLFAARPIARPVAGVRSWAWFVAAGAVTAGTICGLVLLRGTTAHELVNGVVISPLKHPGVYFFAMNWRVGTGALALVSLAAAAWIARGNRWNNPRTAEAIAWTRLVALAVFLCTPLRIIPTSLAAWGMCYGVSLAWLFAAPLRHDDRSATIRAWIAFVLTFEFLQGYPVAGSQINWGTFLWVPLAVLGAWDAAPLVQRRCERLEPWLSRAALTAVAVVALLTASAFTRIGWDRFSTSRPLGLPGAETLRLPDEITSDLQIITKNVRAQADVLFSFPGMFSTNVWTGLPAPTYANVTHWFSLLTPAQQQQIIDRLASSPRAAVLVQPPLIQYLAQHQFPITGLLQEWIAKNFHAALTVGAYEIWVRNGRTVAPLSTGRIAPKTADTASDSLVLTLASAPRSVAKIEICPLVGPRMPIFTLNASNCRATLAPLAASGALTGAAAPAAFPVAIASPLAQLTLNPLQPLPSINWRHVELILRDSHGQTLDTVRFLQ